MKWLFIICIVAYFIHKQISKSRKRAAEQRSPYPPFEVPKGDYGIKVYVYNGEPFKSHFSKWHVCDVLPGEATMQSVYTGTIWTGYCCLVFNDVPIGFIECPSAYGDIVKLLSDKYMRVRVNVHVDGISSGGWPIVTARFPDYDWFKERGYWPC